MCGHLLSISSWEHLGATRRGELPVISTKFHKAKCYKTEAVGIRNSILFEAGMRHPQAEWHQGYPIRDESSPELWFTSFRHYIVGSQGATDTITYWESTGRLTDYTARIPSWSNAGILGTHGVCRFLDCGHHSPMHTMTIATCNSPSYYDACCDDRRNSDSSIEYRNQTKATNS